MAWMLLVILAHGAGKDEGLEGRYRAFTTESYKEAGLNALLVEANAVAQDLQLKEKPAISAKDVTEAHISTPYWSDVAGYFGVLYTSNYYYSVSTDNGLSAIGRRFGRYDEFMKGSVR